MQVIDRIALILAIIGGLNWGSIGLFRFDLVAWICGGQASVVARVIYTLVGLAAIWSNTQLIRGRHEIDGDNIFVNVQELDLRDLSQARLELHRRYIDIQLMLCGPAETFGWSEAKDCVKAETEFDEAKDIQLFTDIPQCFYTVGEGQFSILFPEDGHAPMLGEGHVKKCIFKVRI